MSFEYGTIRGYGVELNDIEPLVDFAKASEHICNTLDYDDHDPIVDLIDCANVLEDFDMMCGLGDLAASIDPHNRLVGVEYNCRYFLVFPLSLPWNRNLHDPYSRKKGNEILLASLRPFLKDGVEDAKIVQHFMEYDEVL